MTTIKLGDKTLVIEDGCNVEVNGDEIRVTPGLSGPILQWPLWQITQPLLPIYPQPAPVYPPAYPWGTTSQPIYQGPTWTSASGGWLGGPN